jgi:hypothetical protein
MFIKTNESHPSYRRLLNLNLVCGLVASITAAAVFVSAASARANIVEFKVVQAQSWLKQSWNYVGPPLPGGISLGTPQVPGSDTTTFFGSMYVDIQPTTIQLLPGAYISAAATGDYQPFDPVVSPPTIGPATTPNANYGLSNAIVGLTAVQYNLRIDNGHVSAPSTPMALAGTNFNLAGQALSFSAGRQAYFSIVQSATTESLVGARMALFGTNGADIGTWDGTTLTIPVHSSILLGGDPEYLAMIGEFTGQLVLVPAVPEPSALVMAGMGLIGLVICRWRKRQVKTLDLS